MSYNYWIWDLLKRLDRKTAEVTFNPHLFDRSEYWNLELGKIEEAVRCGKVLASKCAKPGKICFRLYFSKKNVTYVVIALFHDDFIEVMTVWPKTGR